MLSKYFFLLKRAWEYTSNKKSFVFVYLLFVLANIVLCLKPLVYGYFINKLQFFPDKILDSSFEYVTYFMLIFILYWALNGPGKVLEKKISFGISNSYISKGFEKIIFQPLSWHVDVHSASVISKIKTGAKSLRDFFENGNSYIQIFVQLTISFIGVLYFSPIYALIVIVLGILIVLITVRFDSSYLKGISSINKSENRLYAYFSDALRNVVTIKNLNFEKRFGIEIHNQLESSYSEFKNKISLNEIRWFLVGLIIDLIYCFVIIVYVYTESNKNTVFKIGELVILIGFIDQFIGVFMAVTYLYNKVLNYNGDIKSAEDIENLVSISSEAQPLSHDSENSKIEFKNIYFSFENMKGQLKSSDYLFKGISLTVKANQKIALIGESGSGKSTLLSLLKGLYSPSSDSYIEIDNNSRFDDWGIIAKSCSLFPQKPEIFEGSILYNLTLGLEYPQDEIDKACYTACFEDVIDTFSNGLDYYIHEDGANLSGGQKQRLAIARGLLAASNINLFLLDEASSSLDEKTENRLFQRLFQQYPNKVFICSIHRLHLLKHFDYVYCLQNGDIAVEGSPDSVSNHKFYSLYSTI